MLDLKSNLFIKENAKIIKKVLHQSNSSFLTDGEPTEKNAFAMHSSTLVANDYRSEQLLTRTLWRHLPTSNQLLYTSLFFFPLLHFFHFVPVSDK